MAARSTCNVNGIGPLKLLLSEWLKRPDLPERRTGGRFSSSAGNAVRSLEKKGHLNPNHIIEMQSWLGTGRKTLATNYSKSFEIQHIILSMACSCARATPVYRSIVM